jgi:hypothetical protein
LTHWDRKRRALALREAGQRDTLELFEQEDPPSHDISDVIQYWAARRFHPRWKDLAKMALEYLSIPAMSAVPEQVFSGAKITISDRRCGMGDEAINALECLKSWYRDGLISLDTRKWLCLRRLWWHSRRLGRKMGTLLLYLAL